MTGRQLPWRDRLSETVEWRRRKRRWPSRRASDPDERRMAEWLNTQRRLIKIMDEDAAASRRVSTLDRELSGWRSSEKTTARYEQQWRQTARQVAQYVDEHGHLPTETDIGAKARRLGTWIRVQRADSRAGKSSWTAKRQQVLDEIFPGWDDPTPGAHVSHVTPRDRSPRKPGGDGLTVEWVAKADAAATHLRQAGYLPTAGGNDPREGEMGAWLDHQVRVWRGTKRGQMTPERVEYLDTNLPGWRDRTKSVTRQWDSSRAEKIDAITAMRAQGMSWSQIARVRGISPEAIGQFARRHGIT